MSHYQNLLSTLRASTPEASVPGTPNSSTRPSRRASAQLQSAPVQQVYWNEYDDGSEAENEPYVVYINPDEEAFPGAKVVGFMVSMVKKPLDSVKAWLKPGTAAPQERRPLLQTNDSAYSNEGQSVIDTEADDDTYASSSDFPTGYATHYATFPSVNDQKSTRHHEQLLFRGMLGCFGASFVLLLIAFLLVATGKKKLRAEIDAGVIVGVVSSLFFAIVGYGSMLCRTQKLDWIHRICVGLAFILSCFLNGMLLVYMAGK